MRSTHIGRYPWQAKTHTYHVDTTAGNNANTGAADKPIQTIAGVNALAFKPGDRVLFKRGETWADERLTPGSRGKPGRRILYGAYGPGAAPIINAGTAQGNACYTSTGAYFTLDGLDFRGGTTNCLAFDSHNIAILNCNVQDAAGTGIVFYGATAALAFHGLIVDNCTIHGNVAGQGIEIGAASSPGPSNIMVRGNTVYSNGDTATQDHGIYLYRVSNAQVLNNIGYSNTSGAGVKVRDAVYGVVVAGNKCYGNHYGMVLGTFVADTNVKVYNNLLYSNNAWGAYLPPATVGMAFYHNTIVNNGNADYEFGLELADAACLGNIFKNNLILQDVAVVGAEAKRTPLRVAHVDNATGNTWDNNLLFFVGAPGATVCNLGGTWAEWQALAGEANGVSANPVFVTDYTDLHLQTTSPAKNAGATDLGIGNDYDQVARDATPDIGCYEWVA